MAKTLVRSDMTALRRVGMIKAQFVSLSEPGAQTKGEQGLGKSFDRHRAIYNTWLLKRSGQAWP